MMLFGAVACMALVKFARHILSPRARARAAAAAAAASKRMTLTNPADQYLNWTQVTLDWTSKVWIRTTKSSRMHRRP